MSWFTKLFSSSETVNDVVSGVSSGIDKAILTNEEKLDNFNTLLQLYTPFKIAQRILAIVFCVPYALAFLATFICSFLMDISAQAEMLKGDISIIVGIIITFYFGGGAIEGALKGLKK